MEEIDHLLLIVIPTVWLVIAAFAVIMCRLAARSDASRADALAEQIANSDTGSRPPVARRMPPSWQAAARSRPTPRIRIR
jgi:hypothetical protein